MIDLSPEDMQQRLTELRAENQRLKSELKTLERHADQIADAVGFPAHNINRRNTSVITTCIGNMQRFSGYLQAVEREFLMVPGEPDDDYPDLEPEDECLVNSWGARCTENYVQQFREALAQRQTRAVEAAVKEFADQVWEEMLKRQRVHKVFPLTMAATFLATSQQEEA